MAVQKVGSDRVTIAGLFLCTFPKLRVVEARWHQIESDDAEGFFHADAGESLFEPKIESTSEPAVLLKAELKGKVECQNFSVKYKPLALLYPLNDVTTTVFFVSRSFKTPYVIF